MRDVRDDFPILSRLIDDRPLVYLDSAATSLKPQVVIDAVTNFYTHQTSNIHRAMHLMAEESTRDYENARKSIARFFNADEHEVVFTHGTTEAINLVRRCLPRVERVVTTVMEHHSNYLPWALDAGGAVVGVADDGTLDLDDLQRKLSNGADLLAVCHVSNALGVVNPIDQIVDMAHRAGAMVLVDAAQSAPHRPVDVKAMGADFLACSAHKMLGPGGVGVLYGKSEHLEAMVPWLLGGDMIEQVHFDSYEVQPPPHRFEAGTPAIEAVIGWGAAIEYLSNLDMADVQRHDGELVAYALERLTQIDHVRIVGPTDPDRRCGLVSFQIEDLEAHGVARMLSNRSNIMARSGFLCAQPLHEALGLAPTVRASFHVYNRFDEIDALAENLEAIVALI